MRFLGNEGFLLLRRLPPRDRRAILLGLAVILPAVGYVLGVRPFRSTLAQVRDQVAAEQALLARELALLDAGQTLPESIRMAEESAIRWEGRMLKAPSTVMAEEELTNLLEASAFRNRVLLEEIRTGELARGESPPPGLTVIRLHLRGESDLQGILEFLSEVERERLLLRVRGLALEPEVARQGSGDEGGREGNPLPTGVIDFQLIVDGFARPLDEAVAEAADLNGRPD